METLNPRNFQRLLYRLDGQCLALLHNWDIDAPVNVLDQWDVHCSLYSLTHKHLSLHHHRDVWVRVKRMKESVLGDRILVGIEILSVNSSHVRHSIKIRTVKNLQCLLGQSLAVLRQLILNELPEQGETVSSI